jgi:hypothetical protein
LRCLVELVRAVATRGGDGVTSQSGPGAAAGALYPRIGGEFVIGAVAAALGRDFPVEVTPERVQLAGMR